MGTDPLYIFQVKGLQIQLIAVKLNLVVIEDLEPTLEPLPRCQLDPVKFVIRWWYKTIPG
jgi:hypothetical protein